MKRRLRLHPELAARPLRELSPATKRAMRDALRRLSEDPTGAESRLEVRELQVKAAGDPVFRLRVGDWRAVYRVRGAEVQVLKIFHRREDYGWLERYGVPD